MLTDGLGWGTLALRMAVALLSGAAIGWDRQRAGKPAGVRTHMLVALGACLFILVPVALGAGAEAVSRAIQGVAAGVGFLGGGEILHHLRDGGHDKVKGLTSAAAMWLTAALGVVAACGLWRMAVLAVGTALTVLLALKPLEARLFPKHPREGEP